MKTIKCGVNCQFWNQNLYFEIEVDDNATDEEIREQLVLAAIEEASLDCWIEEPDQQKPDVSYE